MKEYAVITLQNTTDLVSFLKKNELSIAWSLPSGNDLAVLGAHRKMEFFSDNISFAENDFMNQLCEAVIAALALPDTTEDRLYSAEEDYLVFRDGHIYLEYDWSSCEPYMYEYEHKKGTALVKV